MKRILLALTFAFLSACGSGDSSSGAVDPTSAGNMIPANFVGVYSGTLNVTAEAIGIKESDSFPIQITVTSDGSLRFDGDDPEETVTVGITNSGEFAGSITIKEDDCEGTINVTGTVNGSTAVGTVSGEGKCKQSGLSIDVDLSGDFTASK